MTSFSDLGGTPVSASSLLIRDWLKSEQKFSGLVVSDWGSIADLAYFGLASNGTEAAKQALLAGVDMAMTNEAYESHLEQLIATHQIDISLINDAVSRILQIKFSCGLFEHPYTDETLHTEMLRHPKHVDKTLRLAEKCVVMLKNNNQILPIRNDQELTIAVIGPHAHTQRQHLGSWCLDGDEKEVTSIYQGINSFAKKCNVITEESIFSDEMVECANRADIVILCVGESHRRTGEARNISELTLPPGQEELIEAIGKTEKPLIVVQCTGRPIPSKATEHYSHGLLLCWQLGTETGKAIARIIFGEKTPSGKLPISVPRSTGQIPIYYAQKKLGKMRAYQEYQAYKDNFNTPLYPFGFGLSYAKFAYSDLKVEHVKLTSHQPQIVSVTITNISDNDGEEIAQCYIRQEVASTTRPQKALKGFKRIFLKAGESKNITFQLTEKELSFYGVEHKWVMEPSNILVYVGGSSDTKYHTEFELIL